MDPVCPDPLDASSRQPDGAGEVHEVGSFVTSMVATGMTWPDVFAAVLSCYGEAVARSLFLDQCRQHADEDHTEWLSQVAALSPEVANAWLTGLMEDIHQAQGGLHGVHLTRFEWVTSLPDPFVSQGMLSIFGLRNLGKLPRRLNLDGDCLLASCDKVDAVPDGARVGGSLEADGMPSLARIGRNVRVKGHISIKYCPTFVAIGDGLTVGHYMDLSDCTSLERLPRRLKVGSYLDLHGCTALKALPESLTVGASLGLQGCTALTRLPVRLRVDGHLYLNGCAALIDLPEGMMVDGDVDLVGCSSWGGRIPESAVIKGTLATPRHLGGISLKDWRAQHPTSREGEP